VIPQNAGIYRILVDTSLTTTENINNRQHLKGLLIRMNNQKLFPLLLTFSEVALQGSFTKAGKLLGLSKSAVSQQVTRLEKELNIQLLKRNTRGLSVTAFGQTLLKRCELLSGQLDLALIELTKAEAGPQGTFSVIFPHALEKDIVIPALSQLHREFPKLQLSIEVTIDKKDLVKNKLDVAVFGGEPKDSRYRALPVGNSREFFCASAEYLNRAGQPKTPEELSHHPWIANHWQSNPVSIALDTPTATGEKINLTEIARVNAISSSIALAEEHLGIILLPNAICSQLIQSGKLVRVLPEYRGPVWPFYFIHPYQGEKPVHITRFYELVKHYFTKAQVV